jgi:hypothetical protein
VEVLVELLGEAFAGILCSDRCPTSGDWPFAQQSGPFESNKISLDFFERFL